MKKAIAKVEQFPFLFHLLKYVSVGIVNTLVIFGLMFILKDIFKISLSLSNAISYIGGLICNFTLNKIYTFKSHKFQPIEILLFLVAFGVSYGVQRLSLFLLMDQLAWGENWASIVAYPLYGCSFFLLCKYLAFNPKFFTE